MNRIEKDPLQTRIEVSNWLVLFLLVGVALVAASWGFAASVAVGGFISIVNFHWMSRDIFRMFGRAVELSRPPKRSSAIGSFVVRLATTGVVLYLLFASGFVVPLGIVLGLSVVVLNLLLTAGWFVWKRNSLKEV